MEERAARLRAQRDIIKKQKEEKRLKELEQFNKNMSQATGPATGNEDLFASFKQIDKGTNGPNMTEMEKRRAIYQQVRKDITADEQRKKNQNYNTKMAELERKATQKEAISMAQRQKEDEEAAAQAKKQQESQSTTKSLLDNISAFNVE